MELRRAHLMHLFSDGATLIYRRAPGFEAHITPASFIVFSGERVAHFNLAGIAEGLDAEERFRAVGATIREHDLPLLVLIASEVAPELAPLAHELHLENTGSVPLMIYEPTSAPAPRTDLTVELLEDGDSLAESNAIRAHALEIPLDAVERALPADSLDAPGLDVFLGRRDGTAVSTVLTTQHGSVVGIWGTCTAPEYQRQGAGTALLAGVLAHHWERGARHFYLGATLPGTPAFESLGFQRVGEVAAWLGGASGEPALEATAAAHA